jgi:hypothetical protein
MYVYTVYAHTHTHTQGETKNGEGFLGVYGTRFWQEAQQQQQATKPSNQKPAALVNRPALYGWALHAADRLPSRSLTLA